uniref:Uncharacterized protein n=1 Tax=Anopheles coluzzii TaxID=1518534 RepID=A0A8W7NZI1_ANOCL
MAARSAPVACAGTLLINTTTTSSSTSAALYRTMAANANRAQMFGFWFSYTGVRKVVCSVRSVVVIVVVVAAVVLLVVVVDVLACSWSCSCRARKRFTSALPTPYREGCASVRNTSSTSSTCSSAGWEGLRVRRYFR